MRGLGFIILVIMLSASGFGILNPHQGGSADTHAQGMEKTRQMVFVTTSDWNAVRGELQRYERASVREPWHETGEKIPVVVGRSGLAWGKGLHPELQGDGPIKREGDGRSPAGFFSLSSAFGYADHSKIGQLGLPYVQAIRTLECVDDVKSAYYNQVLDRKSVRNPDWKSSEQMLRGDNLYRLGVVVDHNAKHEAGCGSCIFLHIWDGPTKGTSGCTAMEAVKMEEVLRWLDRKKNPVLVQLPQSEVRRLQKVWNLPE